MSFGKGGFHGWAFMEAMERYKGEMDSSLEFIIQHSFS
jgi:hypothetical protein